MFLYFFRANRQKEDEFAKFNISSGTPGITRYLIEHTVRKTIVKPQLPKPLVTIGHQSGDEGCWDDVLTHVIGRVIREAKYNSIGVLIHFVLVAGIQEDMRL